MSDRIALQLYSVRDLANQNYEAAIRKVADFGYRAVETAGFPGSSAQAAKKLFNDLGMTVVAAHTPSPVGEKKNEVLETLEALGKPRMVVTQIGPNDVTSLETIKVLCDRLNEGYEVASANGILYGIHNHWWEFGTLDGRLIHDIMKEGLNPGIFFEIDTYWAQVAGVDPSIIVRSLGARAPLLHIKDGPATREAAMTAVGDGIMDVRNILKAAGNVNPWQIVELDRCDTDMLEAVRKSYQYLSSL